MFYPLCQCFNFTINFDCVWSVLKSNRTISNCSNLSIEICSNISSEQHWVADSHVLSVLHLTSLTLQSGIDLSNKFFPSFACFSSFPLSELLPLIATLTSSFATNAHTFPIILRSGRRPTWAAAAFSQSNDAPTLITSPCLFPTLPCSCVDLQLNYPRITWPQPLPTRPARTPPSSALVTSLIEAISPIAITFTTPPASPTPHSLPSWAPVQQWTAALRTAAKRSSLQEDTSRRPRPSNRPPRALASWPPHVPRSTPTLQHTTATPPWQRPNAPARPPPPCPSAVTATPVGRLTRPMTRRSTCTVSLLPVHDVSLASSGFSHKLASGEQSFFSLSGFSNLKRDSPSRMTPERCSTCILSSCCLALSLSMDSVSLIWPGSSVLEFNHIFVFLIQPC